MKEELLKKRFVELARRSDSTSTYQFTDFLGLNEMSLFEEVKSEFCGINYKKFGGSAGCERVVVRFGDEESFGYDEEFPISILKISPVSQKFADRLTHRDFLGALLNLGIEREKLGDIAVIDNSAYLFLLSDVKEYVKDSLTRVKHTDVRLSEMENIDADSLFKTERRRVQISSERLDAVISKLFNISRESSAALFKRGLVFINGRGCESISKAPKENDVISVRGYGKFIYRGFESKTRKGKLNCLVDLYI